MEKTSRDARREERKQRSEAERQFREQQKKATTMRNRAFFVVGVIAVLVVVALSILRRQDGDGRVWSAEHGHWHDATGREIRP